MDPRSRWLAGLAALLAIAAVAAWLAADRGGEPRGAARPIGRARPASAEPPHDIPPGARAAGGDASSEFSPRAEVASAPGARARDRSFAVVRLRGVVGGTPDPEDAIDVDVFVTPLRDGIRRGVRPRLSEDVPFATQRAGGRRFEVEVTDALATADTWPLKVVARARSGDVTGIPVEVPLVAGGAPLTYARCVELREVELTVSLPAPSPTVVRGRVALPRSPSATACAALVAAGENGAPDAVLASRQVERDGRFALRCAAGISAWLVVTSDGVVPVTIDLGLLQPGTRDAGEIAFSPGVSIRGRVALDAKVAGVRATPSDASVGLASECGTLVWNAGAFAKPSGIVAVDDAGNFDIGGLAPGPYDLHLSLPSTAHGVAGSAMRVHAPAENVLFAPDVVEVKVELYSGGKPVRAGVVWKRSYAAGGFRSGIGSPDRAGRISFWLEPGAHLDLEVEGKLLSITAGAESDAGWRRIDV